MRQYKFFKGEILQLGLSKGNSLFFIVKIYGYKNPIRFWGKDLWGISFKGTWILAKTSPHNWYYSTKASNSYWKEKQTNYRHRIEALTIGEEMTEEDAEDWEAESYNDLDWLEQFYPNSPYFNQGEEDIDEYDIDDEDEVIAPEYEVVEPEIAPPPPIPDQRRTRRRRLF